MVLIKYASAKVWTDITLSVKSITPCSFKKDFKIPEYVIVAGVFRSAIEVEILKLDLTFIYYCIIPLQYSITYLYL